jgi:hypothetical protein
MAPLVYAWVLVTIGVFAYGCYKVAEAISRKFFIKSDVGIREKEVHEEMSKEIDKPRGVIAIILILALAAGFLFLAPFLFANA